jgi:hypothetical protein
VLTRPDDDLVRTVILAVLVILVGLYLLAFLIG